MGLVRQRIIEVPSMYNAMPFGGGMDDSSEIRSEGLLLLNGVYFSKAYGWAN